MSTKENTRRLACVATVLAASLSAFDASAATRPVVSTTAASGIASTAATVNGSVTPKGSDAAAAFDYGTSTSYGSSATASPATVAKGSGATATRASLSGLVCGTTYHYRARATNRTGTTNGSDATFRTSACAVTPTAPSATTNPASNLAPTAATLNASVNPNNGATSVALNLGTTTAYGTTVAASPASIASTAGATSITGSASGLTCATTYHYRVVATNSAGTTNGADQAFTTSACVVTGAPSATTGAASSVGQASASVGGTVNPNGVVTTASFDYGTSTAYGTSVAASPASIAATAGTTSVGAALSGLACNTTYHYRVKGVNASGTGNGADGSFTTAACGQAQLDCSAANVLCVPSEYATLQAAADVAKAGDTVLVADGTYTGFVASRSGTSSARITFKAAGTNALINKANSLSDGIQVKNASYVTIEGFKIVNMPQYGVSARGASATAPMHGVIFRGNTSTGAGSSNFYASQVADSLLEDNIGSGATGEHGMYVANGGSDNTVIRGNILFSNAINGLHLNGDISVGGDGLHTGITIEENTIYNNAANAMDLDGVQSSTIRNNVIYGNGHHGIRVFQIDAAAGPKNLAIVNNTIVIPSNSSGGAPIKLSEDGGGNTIFNNILLSDGTGGSIVVGSSLVKSDFNVFGGSALPAFSLDAGGSTMTFTAWRGKGYDGNSILSSASALFVATGDYRLKAGSPAANTGTASLNGVAAPANDIDGVGRPLGGAFDIGAHESF